MIRSIGYRVGICPFKVNCDAVTDSLLLHGAAEVSFNLRNALNDRSVDVAGVTATIYMYYSIRKNLETYQIEPCSVLPLAIRKQSCGLIRAHDE